MAKVMMKATRLVPMNWRVRKRANSTIGAATRSSIADEERRARWHRRPAARGSGRAPAPAVALDQAEDDRGQARGQRDHARVVDPAIDGLVTRLGDGEDGGDHGAHGDWKVDEEDRPPAHVLGEEAADHGADREGQGGYARPGADRLAALGRGEGMSDDREGRGHHQRRADALDRAAADQHRRVLREASGRGGDREDDHPVEEHPAAPEDVAQATAGGDQHREGQGVAVDDPLERRDAGRGSRAGSTAAPR